MGLLVTTKDKLTLVSKYCVTNQRPEIKYFTRDRMPQASQASPLAARPAVPP